MMKKSIFFKSLILLFLLGAFYSCVKDEQFSNRQTAKEGIIRTLQVGEMNKNQRILEALEYINETFGDSLQNPYTVFEAGGIYNSLGDYHSYTFFIYKHGAEDNHIRNLLLSWDGVSAYNAYLIDYGPSLPDIQAMGGTVPKFVPDQQYSERGLDGKEHCFVIDTSHPYDGNDLSSITWDEVKCDGSQIPITSITGGSSGGNNGSGSSTGYDNNDGDDNNGGDTGNPWSGDIFGGPWNGNPVNYGPDDPTGIIVIPGLGGSWPSPVDEIEDEVVTTPISICLQQFLNSLSSTQSSWWMLTATQEQQNAIMNYLNENNDNPSSSCDQEDIDLMKEAIDAIIAGDVSSIEEFLNMPCPGDPVKNPVIAPQKGSSGAKGSLFGCTRYGDNECVGEDGRNKEHNGIDIKNAFGEPVFAMYDGTASKHEFSNAGNIVYIQSVVNGQTISIQYFHLQDTGRVTGQVQAGDIIGYQGDSGNLKNAIAAGGVESHVHIKIKDANNNAVDPRAYMATEIDDNGNVTNTCP